MNAGLGARRPNFHPVAPSAASFEANSCGQTRLTPWREIWASLCLAKVRANHSAIEAFLNSLFAEAVFGDDGAWFPRGRHMQCQRCWTNDAQYRATTDAIDIKICAFCAEEARKLRITVEALGPGSKASRPHLRGSSTGKSSISENHVRHSRRARFTGLTHN